MAWNDIPQSERIIVALDCSADEALELGKKLAGKARWVKIGMTLYYAEGPAIVKHFHDLGFKVFIDLKLHDIPHQILGASRAVASVGADLLTVHAAGGVPMMEAAVQGASEGAQSIGADKPIICGITVLTSMDDETLASIGVNDCAAVQVERLAKLTQEAGLTGVVCSPREAAAMRQLLGPDAAVVTPGVRPAGAALGDQNRVATPKAAFEAGASHLVIGRPITQADDPVAAFDAIVEELSA